MINLNLVKNVFLYKIIFVFIEYIQHFFKSLFTIFKSFVGIHKDII